MVHGKKTAMSIFCKGQEKQLNLSGWEICAYPARR
jgi:hypothetical protein